MVSAGFDDTLLGDKKSRFLAAVRRICRRRHLPEPYVNFDGCDSEDQDQLAHYHPDLHQICVSESQLRKVNFDEIEEIAAHEVSHIREQNHDPEFEAEQDRSQQANFDIPGGIVHINGGKEVKRIPLVKTKPDPHHCNYHLCKKKADLLKCKYCGRYFCEDHQDPHPTHIGTGYHHDSGHPCAGYADYQREQRLAERNEFAESLRQTKFVKHQDEEIQRAREERYRRRKENKRIQRAHINAKASLVTSTENREEYVGKRGAEVVATAEPVRDQRNMSWLWIGILIIAVLAFMFVILRGFFKLP